MKTCTLLTVCMSCRSFGSNWLRSTSPDLERRGEGVLVGVGLVDPLVEVGFPPVVVVALESDVVVGHPFLEGEGAAGDGGAVFSGASSRFLLVSFGSRYLPKTLCGMIWTLPISLSAGQKELTSVTVMMLPSRLMPEMSEAEPSM